jgi:integrase
MQAKSQLALVVPTGEKRAVAAGRRSNADYRKREYLTPAEIEKLIEAAKGNRYGHRDATMILVAFRHGLRASEIIELEWSDIDFDTAEMHVERKKRGKSPRHPIRGDELRALRRLHKEQDPKSTFVFVSERGAPFTRDSFNWMVKRAGKKADLPFQVHAHMLRHSTGYKLANDGADTRSIQSYLGHRDIRHTVRYTELSAKPFRDFFRD